MLLVAMLHLVAYWASLAPPNVSGESSHLIDRRPDTLEWVFISPPRTEGSFRTHSADLAVHPRVTAPTPKSLARPLTPPDDSSTNHARESLTTDWNSELELVAKGVADRGDGSNARRAFGGSPPRPALAPKPPTFDWDPVHTHRVEIGPEGGMIVHLSDNCVMVFAPFPFPMCGIGKKEANGHLLDHMHDAPSIEEAPSVPMAPAH